MLEKIKNTIIKYPIFCCLFAAISGFSLYGICVFLSSCSSDEILKVIPAAILGIITTYIAYQQHLISKSQKQIAEDKHRLELFEKRFETYELFLDAAVKSHKLSPNRMKYDSPEAEERDRHRNLEYLKFIKDNESKIISLGEGALFLFGPDVKHVLSMARGNIFGKQLSTEKLNSLREKKANTRTLASESAEKDHSERVEEDFIRGHDQLLKEFYERKLSEIMGPYLRIAPYISKD